jgi:hypothetical protein
MPQLNPILRKHPAISTEVLRFVSPKVLHALRAASENLTRLGIRHAICGGVAVGAYGHVRATKDVDFLVGDEAFVVHGSLVTFAAGVPWAVEGIPTDMVPLSPPDLPAQNLAFMEDELNHPFDLAGMPIVSPEALVTMKLVAHRARDLDDVAALLDAGATHTARVVAYLTKNGREDLRVWLDEAVDRMGNR